MRIGIGYDVHRLVPDRKLILGGVEIPHELGLLGHSDADVLTHALMDALLGAIGAGDIGKLFPDTDAQYKGISSIVLLRRVMERVTQAGYRVGNVDVIVIAQKPKLGGYFPQMKEVLALIRQAQWRWDFGVASHGGAFHAPQEIQRVLSHGLDRAMQARLAISKVLAKHGYTDNVPMPDISTKDKAQEYIGLDMDAERAAKDKFLKTTVPAWLEKAKANNRLALK